MIIWGLSPRVQNLDAGGPPAAEKSFALLGWWLLDGGPADVTKGMAPRVGTCWVSGEGGDVVLGRCDDGGAGGPKSTWVMP